MRGVVKGGGSTYRMVHSFSAVVVLVVHVWMPLALLDGPIVCVLWICGCGCAAACLMCVSGPQKPVCSEMCGMPFKFL